MVISTGGKKSKSCKSFVVISKLHVCVCVSDYYYRKNKKTRMADMGDYSTVQKNGSSTFPREEIVWIVDMMINE